jgi:hypothetical protein
VKLPDEDDWRLREKFDARFRGLILRRERWTPGPALTWLPGASEPEPSTWGHDHCEFCWTTFGTPDADDPDLLVEGYVANLPSCSADVKPERLFRDLRVEAKLGDDRWICPTCFEDFRDHFGWKLEEPRA